MKIAVVGCGIFGSVIAIKLAENGYSVDVFEKNSKICQAASTVNQYRVHRGYHYPRSIDTIKSCIVGESKFRETFKDVLIKDLNSYYAISKYNSYLTSEQCCNIWDSVDLKYDEIELEYVNYNEIDKVFKVEETLFDGILMNKILLEKLEKYNINIHFNSKVDKNILEKYDMTIVCTYSNNNDFLSNDLKRNYQFELCEKILVKMPQRFVKESIVVMDGPFMCFDPYSTTPYHLMGNVKHAIHKTDTSNKFDVPIKYLKYLNSGICNVKNISNFKKFYDDLNKFFIGVKNTEYIGSMFTVRTVLPKHEHDDARPTIVERINEKQINVFSGKIPTCIDASEMVLDYIANPKL